ncbi:MAG TPA: GAF domain-containing sensor histidine kinase [Atribacteraceae bacterium]|nr:GAF domain-containing sensor histidine kinase [Atribacteraceae bacterium]
MISTITETFSGTERECLDHIVDLAIVISGASTGSILLAEDNSRLTIAAGRGLREEYIGSTIPLSVDSVSEEVYRTGKPILIGEADISFPSRRRERNELSISLPIKRENGQVVGVLNLNRSGKSFDHSGLPRLQALTTNIALLIEENALRRDRERILVALSEITPLFSGMSFTECPNDVFSRIYYSVKILTGIRQAAVFRLSRVRPYLVYRQEWPKTFTWKRLQEIHGLVSDYLETRKPGSMTFEEHKRFLVLPISLADEPYYLFLGIQEQPIDIIDSLVLSMVANLSGSCLQNLFLFGESRKLTRMRERNRIARELHDGLAQILASTQIYLHFLENSQVSFSEEQRKVLEKIKSLNDLGLEESRFIISELKGKPVSRSRFEEKIQDLVRLFSSPGLDIHLDSRIPVPKIPYGIFKMVTLIVQEALANIQKHAEANQVEVSLVQQNNTLSILVKDNGKGFNMREKTSKNQGEHFGLSNLRERIRLLKGSFRVFTRPGEGTRIMAKIPLPED